MVRKLSGHHRPGHPGGPSAGYQPLIEVKGLPLVTGKLSIRSMTTLKNGQVDLKSYWNGWPNAAHRQLKNAKVLKAGVDYDQLVLAMYPGANGITN